MRGAHGADAAFGGAYLRLHARVLTSTPATTQGTVPLLIQSCGVPCCTTESPGRSVISRPSKTNVISPEMTAMRSIVSVA